MIYPCERLNCLGINPPLTLITCSNSCSTDSSLSAHLKDVLTDEFSDINGRFHTRGRTNRLVGQIVSDEQIVRILDVKGRSALWHAKSAGSKECADILRHNGCNDLGTMIPQGSDVFC